MGGLAAHGDEEMEEWGMTSWKEYIREHLFEIYADFIGPILLTALLLYLCKAEEFMYGILLSIAYSLGKLIYRLSHYNKEYNKNKGNAD